MDARIFVRVRDRPGALERVMGLLRRRAFGVRRVSVALGDDDALELMLRLAEPERHAERARQELRELVDVVDARHAGDPHREPTREMLVAWLPDPPPDAALPAGRTTTDEAGGTTLEVTGSPEELDAVIARLRESGIRFRFARSGEVAVPRAPDTEAARASVPDVDSRSTDAG